MKPYPVKIEQMMRQFYATLSEKDKRRYAAVEARKLERGGMTYIARVLGCDLDALPIAEFFHQLKLPMLALPGEKVVPMVVRLLTLLSP